MKPSFVYFPSIVFPSALRFGPRLNEAQGRHDLRARISTDLGSYYYQTGLHESIHEDLLYQTSFGNYHRLLRAIADSDEAGHALRENAGILIDAFYSASITAHECAATYCAVKGGDIRAKVRLVSELPDGYDAFFYRISRAVDENFSCSFIQYLVGYKICEYAFMGDISPLIEAWGGEVRFDLPLEVQPDWRLRALEDFFTRDRWGEFRKMLLSACAEDPGLNAISPRFELDREAAWEALKIDDQYAANLIVGSQIESLLYGKIRPLPCTIDKKFFDRFVVDVAIWNQVGALVLIDERGLCPISGARLSPYARYKLITAGAAYISNQFRTKCHYGSSPEHREGWKSEWGYSAAVWNIRGQRGVEAENWVLVRYLVKTQRTTVVEVPTLWLNEQAGEAKIAAKKGDRILALPFSLVICRVWPPIVKAEVDAFYFALAAANELLAEDGPDRYLYRGPREEFIWYMDGNVVIWIEWLLRASKSGRALEYGWQCLGFSGFTDGRPEDDHARQRLEEGQRFILYLITESMPGIFMRIVDCYSSVALRLMTASLERDEKLVALKANDDPEANAAIAKALACIERTWDFY